MCGAGGVPRDGHLGSGNEQLPDQLLLPLEQRQVGEGHSASALAASDCSGVGAEAVALVWQVVSADHSGLVRLNNYPAVCAYTPCFAHRGHASHVTRTPSPPQPSAPSAGCAGADGRCGLQLCSNWPLIDL